MNNGNMQLPHPDTDADYLCDFSEQSEMVFLNYCSTWLYRDYSTISTWEWPEEEERLLGNPFTVHFWYMANYTYTFDLQITPE